ncbi:ABC transporter ATP-binding protein [Campylobacter sp. MIT 21-1685]|uniref:ABC transporter ATP-binding protein n=1 Tax=unclassified Campylobacter TaxID=2593542 RepID=UPI00224A76C3|nr:MULTISPECIES: ABC transporter ATP-binding protein [unclassified Campylobacter]MCX2683545.1 ABC transporter ATP-binding protein [Campylobacter sp. MIT 21-1684]MCX2751794.1 ABC transporter ATP-binding protein [Campylobacter sp. MIT 21-1682]MCX2808029.1 ABC transporter ATP-binding protein [Campylobacter sp. MIT 21-1685]
MSVFALENACFSYRKELVFEGLSFCVDKGEILGILGHNGVGKTTLIKCCIGILSLQKGQVFLQGQHIKKLSHKQFFSQVAYVPQAKNSLTKLSVFDMVLLGANIDITTTPKKIHLEKAEALLEKLRISFLKGKACSNLSGGELQMVVLARSLMNDPDLLILDEPESNLDFKNQDRILDVLLELKNQGKSIIINTHFPQNAYKLADKVLILQKNSHILGDKSLINKTQLSQSFEVRHSFFDYLNLA